MSGPLALLLLHPSHKLHEANDPGRAGKPGPNSTRGDRHISTNQGRAARAMDGYGGRRYCSVSYLLVCVLTATGADVYSRSDRQHRLATLTTDFHLVTAHRSSFRSDSHNGANHFKYPRTAPVSPTNTNITITTAFTEPPLHNHCDKPSTSAPLASQRRCT